MYFSNFNSRSSLICIANLKCYPSLLVLFFWFQILIFPVLAWFSLLTLSIPSPSIILKITSHSSRHLLSFSFFFSPLLFPSHLYYFSSFFAVSAVVDLSLQFGFYFFYYLVTFFLPFSFSFSLHFNLYYFILF